MRWREAPWRSQIRARWRDAGEEPSWGEARRRRGERAEWRGGMSRRGGERRGLVRPFLPAFLLSFVPLFNLSVTPPPSHRTPVPQLRALVNGDEWPHTATVEPLRSAENVDLGAHHHAIMEKILESLLGRSMDEDTFRLVLLSICLTTILPEGCVSRHVTASILIGLSVPLLLCRIRLVGWSVLGAGWCPSVLHAALCLPPMNAPHMCAVSAVSGQAPLMPGRRARGEAREPQPEGHVDPVRGERNALVRQTRLSVRCLSPVSVCRTAPFERSHE